MNDHPLTVQEQSILFEDFIKQKMLDDVCFDVQQIRQLREIYSINVYSPTRSCYAEMIESIKSHMKGLRDEYERRFRTKLTREDVERAFKGYREDFKYAGGGPGSSINNDPSFEPEDMGS